MQRRILLLVAALVVALAGTTMVFVYFSKKDAVAAEPEQQAPVLVATQLIPAGTSGQQAVEQELVQLTEIPARLLPPGALADVVPVKDQIAAYDVQPGEMLLRTKFIDRTRAGALEIPDDKVAISVEVRDPQRVASFVKPGSDIAIFDTYAVEAPAQDPRALPAGAAAPVVDSATRLLLARATVVAVGPSALKTAGGEPGAGTGQEEKEVAPEDEGLAAIVTVAVTVEDAQKLAHAAQTGQLYFSLLSAQSRTDIDQPVDNRTLFN